MSSKGPAAYSLYELLRLLIDRVGWPTEEEKNAARGSVDQAERMGIFGDLALMMTCDHPDDEPGDRINGRCMLCGRLMVQQTHKVGGDAGYRYLPGKRTRW